MHAQASMNQTVINYLMDKFCMFWIDGKLPNFLSSKKTSNLVRFPRYIK